MDDFNDKNFGLIQKYQQGDEKAFSELFYKFYPFVFNTLIAKGIPKTDAEDTTAEIFIKLAESLKNYHFEKPLEHYLRRIVRNKIFDYYRSQRIKWYPLIVENLVSTETGNFEIAEIEEIINQCLQKITNLTRRAIILSWLEGYTRKQISVMLNLPIGTIHSNLERGKTVFKQCIQGKLS